MKCAMCNSNLVPVRETVKFTSRTVGTVKVPDISYFRCGECGDELYPQEAASEIHNFVKKKEEAAINDLPVRGFVSANEAAMMLNITKQAFSKNPKIRNGFIYSVSIGDRKYYHTKSIKMYHETGDGRFNVIDEIHDAKQNEACGLQRVVSQRRKKLRKLGEMKWRDSMNGVVVAPSFGKADDYSQPKIARMNLVVA